MYLLSNYFELKRGREGQTLARVYTEGTFLCRREAFLLTETAFHWNFVDDIFEAYGLHLVSLSLEPGY